MKYCLAHVCYSWKLCLWNNEGMTHIISICHGLKLWGPHAFCVSCASGYFPFMMNANAYNTISCTPWYYARSFSSTNFSVVQKCASHVCKEVIHIQSAWTRKWDHPKIFPLIVSLPINLYTLINSLHFFKKYSSYFIICDEIGHIIFLFLFLKYQT